MAGSTRKRFCWRHSNEVSKLYHDISLKYHGNGIKVDQVASCVGINWDLDIGAVITREVRNRPDEIGFLNEPAEKTNLSNSDVQYLYDINLSNLDGEMDIYKFQVGGISGEFVIGKNNIIRTIPQSNIQITRYLPNGLFTPTMTNPPTDACLTQSFAIKLENGVVYQFESYSCEKMGNYYGGGIADYKNYASERWYLTKIIHLWMKRK